MSVRKLFVPNIDANRTIDIVHELRALGLQNHIDFNFCYVQSKQNWIELDDDYTAECQFGGAEFTFYEDKWATWFALKYL